MMYPTFMDKFGSRLISQLIGMKHFQSKLLKDNNINHNSGTATAHSSNDNVVTTRLYWRTKYVPCCSSSSTSNQNGAHVYFLDVTVDFSIVTNSTSTNDNNCNQTPKIETKFGALIKRCTATCCTATSCTAATETKEQGDKNKINGAHYIQTQVFTKQALQKYAQELQIDLDETGPIQMANTIAKALQSYYDHTIMKKCNIPPSMKLFSVPILSTTIGSSSHSASNVDFKDRIGLYHMELMEQGYIHFPYQNQSSNIQSFIGQAAFDMMVTNLIDYDQHIKMSLDDNKFDKNYDKDQSKRLDEILQQWWEMVIKKKNVNHNHDIAEKYDKYVPASSESTHKGTNNDQTNQQSITTEVVTKKGSVSTASTATAAAATTTRSSSSSVDKNNNESNSNESAPSSSNKKRRILQVSRKSHAMSCTSIRTKKKQKGGKMTIGKMK